MACIYCVGCRSIINLPLDAVPFRCARCLVRYIKDKNDEVCVIRVDNTTCPVEVYGQYEQIRREVKVTEEADDDPKNF